VKATTMVVAAVMAVGLTGCCDKFVEKAAEKAAEKAVEEATGGDASLAIGDNVDISALPVAFRYPGVKAKGRFAQNTPTGSGTVYMLESDDPIAKVKAHFEALTGYKQTAKMDTADGSMFAYEAAPGESYNVVLSPTAGKTVITITHAKDKP